MHPKVRNFIHSEGLKHQMRDSEIIELYESQFDFIQKKIEELEIPEDSEKVDNLKSTFILRFWGKIYIDKTKLKKKIDGKSIKHE